MSGRQRLPGRTLLFLLKGVLEVVCCSVMLGFVPHYGQTDLENRGWIERDE